MEAACASGHTDLCMWDRSLWGRPHQQRERLRGRTVSGIPVWSACPLGTAGTHRLGGVQTHLRKTYRGNSHWIFEEVPTDAAFCREQSKLTRSRSTVILNSIPIKHSTTALLATHVDVKDEYCWTAYFKCMEQMCVNKPFSFYCLVILFQPLRLYLLFPFPSSVIFFELFFPSVPVFGKFDIKKLKSVKRSCYPPSPFSSPTTFQQTFCDISLLFSTLSDRLQQVSPISKVKPLPVSWSAAMTLTRLSHHATLLSCLRGRHLSGTDRSIALSLSSCLPLCSVNATTRCSEQLLPRAT